MNGAEFLHDPGEGRRFRLALFAALILEALAILAAMNVDWAPSLPPHHPARMRLHIAMSAAPATHPTTIAAPAPPPPPAPPQPAPPKPAPPPPQPAPRPLPETPKGTLPPHRPPAPHRTEPRHREIHHRPPRVHHEARHVPRPAPPAAPAAPSPAPAPAPAAPASSAPSFTPAQSVAFQAYAEKLAARVQQAATTPDSVYKAGVDGTAHIRMLVSPDGQVQKVWLEATSGSDAIDQAALEAARQTRPPRFTADMPQMSLPFGFGIHLGNYQ